MNKLFVISLLAIGLSACTAMQGSNNYGSSNVKEGDIMWDASKPAPQIGQRFVSQCPQPIIDTAFTNAANMANLQPGMDKPSVYRVMGIPQRATSVRLTDNRLYEVLYYLIGAPNCVAAADVPMEGDYLPVIFNGGRMVGYGQVFYDTQVAPQLFQAVPAPVSLHPNTPLAPTQNWR